MNIIIFKDRVEIINCECKLLILIFRILLCIKSESRNLVYPVCVTLIIYFLYCFSDISGIDWLICFSVAFERAMSLFNDLISVLNIKFNIECNQHQRNHLISND